MEARRASRARDQKQPQDKRRVLRRERPAVEAWQAGDRLLRRRSQPSPAPGGGRTRARRAGEIRAEGPAGAVPHHDAPAVLAVAVRSALLTRGGGRAASRGRPPCSLTPARNGALPW